jgi:hypothetical protein
MVLPSPSARASYCGCLLTPGFRGYRPTPKERLALIVAVAMNFAMQMACESRTREAYRGAQAAHGAQVARDAQAARAANAKKKTEQNAPRVESGLVPEVQAVLPALFVLYVLYELARACYRCYTQLLFERGIALRIAQV